METDSKIFMVLEYCPGGELFDYIVDRERLNEEESRSFFRQIVAGVAFIHESGYAHRDLKPENILIDDDQQLKLIDFGLCANPKGGITSILETCCGSPAYAAPELVSGRNYLGSEADIWSMGVLLYALLCGFLPFDDENISSLYRKIQSGIYEKPTWLSLGSLELINQMLQVDAKKRITIKQLLTHPWLMEGYERPVKWQSKFHGNDLDVPIIEEMAGYKMTTPNALSSKLKQWDYDYLTSTYLLLFDKKQKGQSVRLTPGTSSPMLSLDLLNKEVLTTPKRNLLKEMDSSNTSPMKSNSLADSPRGLHNSLEGGLDDSELLKMGNLTPSKKDDLERSTKNRASERYPVPHKKAVKEDKENVRPSAPNACGTPVKKTTYPSAQNSPLSPSRSVDSGLNKKEWVFATPEKPVGGYKKDRKVLGSIERGLDRMKNMLTPRKHSHDVHTRPNVISGKGLCNVSTTSAHNPDQVLDELTRALISKGIPCQQKGYILRGKIKDKSGMAKLSFELEVCRIPNLNVVGIRRKRLKGDAWCYKKVCEEVLRLAAVSGGAKWSTCQWIHSH